MGPRERKRPDRFAVLIAAFRASVLLAGAILLTTPAEEASLREAVRDAVPAREPFPHLTETDIQVGEQHLTVVIADETGERSQGLRRRETIGPYGGMLFAYETPVQFSFTMSTVPVPLEIAFYDARGRLVKQLQMEPCPATNSECPSYRAGAEFVYALETLEGDLPKGRLAV